MAFSWRLYFVIINVRNPFRRIVRNSWSLAVDRWQRNKRLLTIQQFVIQKQTTESPKPQNVANQENYSSAKPKEIEEIQKIDDEQNQKAN